MTAFVDPRSGVMTPAWYRFFYSIWERTGGAPATSTIDDVIETLKMSDVTPAANPDLAAWLGAVLGDVVTPMQTESAVWQAVSAGDIPRVPENDPMMISLMVA
jgi:hypothetical protein